MRCERSIFGDLKGGQERLRTVTAVTDCIVFSLSFEPLKVISGHAPQGCGHLRSFNDAVQRAPREKKRFQLLCGSRRLGKIKDI